MTHCPSTEAHVARLVFWGVTTCWRLPSAQNNPLAADGSPQGSREDETPFMNDHCKTWVKWDWQPNSQMWKSRIYHPRSEILQDVCIGKHRSIFFAKLPLCKWQLTSEIASAICSIHLSKSNGSKCTETKTKTTTTSFFQVSLWFLKWRSLNPWKGHFLLPNGSLGRTWKWLLFNFVWCSRLILIRSLNRHGYFMNPRGNFLLPPRSYIWGQLTEINSKHSGKDN